MPLIATRGAASAQGFGEFAQSAAPVYIEDVFSTWLYTGNDSTQTITNGIDLSGKGGLIWLKKRSNTSIHGLWDTARGGTKRLNTSAADAETTLVDSFTFNSDGFTIPAGGSSYLNESSANTYTSWTFREQPKFFDIVTYSGDSVDNRQISHNLESTPGCVIVRRLSGDNWFVYHRSLAANYGLRLDTTSAADSNTSTVKSVSSTTFTVGTDGMVNTTGSNYVAYLFAHDAGGFGLTGSDNVISCGSFTGAGSTTPVVINLGFEPQWLLAKQSSGTGGSWVIVDNMRGFTATTNGNVVLYPNSSGADDPGNYIPGQPTSTGFNGLWSSGQTYIYIAIRRGPMKTPTSGTSVFYPQAVSQAVTIDSTNVPFPPDLVNTFSRNGTQRTTGYTQFQFADRLRSLGVPSDTFSGSGCPALVSSSTDVEGATASYIQLKADSRNITRSNGWNDPLYGNWIYYFMRRAPGFFDEVCYTGTGSNQNITHNLGVAPELIIVKSRSSNPGANWVVWNTTLNSSTGYLYLNGTLGGSNFAGVWNGAPTSTYFTLGTNYQNNGSGVTFVAYLFATVAGVSKVGSYTGTGTTLQVNCGFTNGSRFVLIKRTDSTGDWYVWDSARGIVAGNDPYLLLNSTAEEVTNTDYVDTYSAGFEISSTAPAAINANGGTFIFLAIA
jgi:hypothetical protein